MEIRYNLVHIVDYKNFKEHTVDFYLSLQFLHTTEQLPLTNEFEERVFAPGTVQSASSSVDTLLLLSPGHSVPEQTYLFLLLLHF